MIILMCSLFVVSCTVCSFITHIIQYTAFLTTDSILLYRSVDILTVNVSVITVTAGRVRCVKNGIR